MLHSEYIFTDSLYLFFLVQIPMSVHWELLNALTIPSVETLVDLMSVTVPQDTHLLMMFAKVGM